MKHYDLRVIKDIPIRDLAEKLGIVIIGNHNTGNAKCFNQAGHPKGDRNPSLGFDHKTNRFKCFACNVKGSTIDLVMATQNLSFNDACEWLANSYGLRPDNTGKIQEIKPITYKDYKQPETIITTGDIEIYQEFYQLCDQLDTTGLKFMQSKGFTPETIKKFGWRIITDKAISLIKQRNNSDSGIAGIYQAGWWLIPFYQDDQIVYLRARNPIKKEFRNLIGKDTQIYNYNAFYELTGDSSLYICEGETDTMTLTQQGLTAVGVLGATQDRTISRLVDFITTQFSKDLSVILCFDNDKEGKEATEKTAKQFFAKGLTPEVLKIPDNYKDINDYVNETELNNGKKD